MILWVGSIEPTALLERLLAAFDLHVTYRDPDARLVIAGHSPDPVYLAALRRYRAELVLLGLDIEADPARGRLAELGARATATLAPGAAAEAPSAAALASRLAELDAA